MQDRQVQSFGGFTVGDAVTVEPVWLERLRHVGGCDAQYVERMRSPGKVQAIWIGIDEARVLAWVSVFVVFGAHSTVIECFSPGQIVPALATTMAA